MEYKGPKLEYFPIFQDLIDVFLDKGSGLPPKRHNDFSIDLVLRVARVFNTYFKMSTP
jgi:hypothetical protein